MRDGRSTHHDVEAMYREYGGVIYSHCRRWLRNDSQAEDAVQEVFVKMLQSPRSRLPLGDAEGRAAALHWMRRVATNHCLDRLRRRGVRGEDRAAPELEEGFVDPESELEGRDLVRVLLRRTPESVLRPAVLFHVEGHDQLAIAQSLGVSRRTVCNRLKHFSTRMARARINLEVASA